MLLLAEEQPAILSKVTENLCRTKRQIRKPPSGLPKTLTDRLSVGIVLQTWQKAVASPGGSGNAPRFPARQETTHPQDRFPKRNEGQRPARRGRSARHGRGGRWPGALAPGGCAARAARGRGDGPGQSSGSAKDIHAFRSGSPCSWHFCNASQRVINVRTNRCRMADMSKAVQSGRGAWREFNP